MLSVYAEKLLAKILSYGAALTTILVVTKTVTDPVNAPKLLSLGIVGASAIGILLVTLGKGKNQSLYVIGTFVLFFLLAATTATLFSSSPLSQNFYGTYGRNNGLIAYIFLASIMVSAVVLQRRNSFDLVVRALLIAGLVNIVYCGWVILFGDFIGWNNPYGNILGTFGNPNFIGAFLGIFLSAYVAYAISSNKSHWWRWSLLLVVPITIFEIVDSSAIQGRVVAAGGLALVIFSHTRYKVNGVILGLYSSVISIIGVFALCGALQVGPLTQYIYKTSVSLRGQYWLAGWNAGESHPFTGVGMDALGDWYRRVRDPQSIVLPGVNTVVNAAHNVFMDMFAFGGWPLFIAYVALVAYSGVALLRTFIRLKKFDGTFTAIAGAWIGYQVQSIISINQIGLAIWGWLLGGALIAYERSTRSQETLDEVAVSRKQKSALNGARGSEPRVLLSTFLVGLIGFIVSLPPFISDTKWKSAMSAQSLPQIEESMKASYFNPQNVNKYVMNVRLLEESKLPDLARKYALEAVTWNPESYELWKFLYFISGSTPEEKVLAREKMQLLDPLNPDVTTP